MTNDGGEPQQAPEPSPPPAYLPTSPPAPGYPQVGHAQPGTSPPGYPQPGYAQPGAAPPGYPQPGSYPPPGSPPPGYPPPGYPPPGAQPPGYPQPGSYPPPGYPPPGTPPPPGYAQPGYAQPGYPQPGAPPPGYPQPGYYPPPGYPPGPIGPPPALKPGVIPLRPLSLGEIFNGAVAYIRANPKATLGLTAIVIVATQVLALVLQVGPLAAIGQLDALGGDTVSDEALLGIGLGTLAGIVATVVATILLSGMLTVVVGRAVFGAGITIGEAWQRVKGRLWALIGLTALQAVGGIVIIGLIAAITIGVGAATNPGVAVLVGFPLVLGAIAGVVYLFTMLTFAPVLIVLERLAVVPAIVRSFALVRGSFWRVLGIRLLGTLIAGLVANAVAIPFMIGGQIMLIAGTTAGVFLLAVVLTSIGSAIGEIITAPFVAGVVALLYTDRRIRAEAFDLVLQTGAAGVPNAPPDSTDHLWLTQQPAAA